MEAESFKMVFNGADEIDLETLSYSLNSTLECLKIIADEVITKEELCKFVIKSVEKGSFIIDIAVVKEILQIFIPAAAGIVTIFTGIFALRKHIKGKKPKEIKKDTNDTSIVINADGDKHIIKNQVLNIYISNDEIEKQLSAFSSFLSEDDNRTSFSVEEKNCNGEIVNSVSYSKEDLKQTAACVDLSSLISNLEENIDIVWVKLKKAIFQGDSKWEVIILLNNSNITVSIEDTDFLNKVRNAELNLNAETQLQVELRTRKRVDCNGQVMSKLSYSILKVLKTSQPQKPVQERMTLT